MDFTLPGLLNGNIKLAHDIGLEGLKLGFMRREERGFTLGQQWFRDYYMEEGDKWNIQFQSMAVCEFDFCGLKHSRGTEKGDRVRDINLLYPEIHVKDGLNKKDSSAYLGEGETDFDGTMEILKKANYKGWLHLENFYDRKPLCDTQASFIEVAKHDLALLKQACE